MQGFAIASYLWAFISIAWILSISIALHVIASKLKRRFGTYSSTLLYAGTLTIALYAVVASLSVVYMVGYIANPAQLSNASGLQAIAILSSVSGLIAYLAAPILFVLAGRELLRETRDFEVGEGGPEQTRRTRDWRPFRRKPKSTGEVTWDNFHER